MSPRSVIAQALKADPKHTRQFLSDVATLEQSPVYRRVKRVLDHLLERDQLSFTLLQGATAIDPLSAALREGMKFPLLLLEEAGGQGREIKESADDGDGFTVNS